MRRVSAARAPKPVTSRRREANAVPASVANAVPAGRKTANARPRTSLSSRLSMRRRRSSAGANPVTLPEMNAHDRRIIHVTLKDDPELTTESMGEGAMKKVVISLKKED